MLHRNGIPGPDNLSALSTTIELLQLLLPEDTSGVITDQEDPDAMEEELLKRTNEISISVAQMRNFLKFDSSIEDGPLKTLEKRLEVCDKYGEPRTLSVQCVLCNVFFEIHNKAIKILDLC